MGTIGCRCDEIAVLRGPDARVYADDHLTIHTRQDSGERLAGGLSGEEALWVTKMRQKLAGTGFGECQCPLTGWRFAESWQRDPDSYQLRRRPWTTRADYLNPALIAERAAEVAAAKSRISETLPFRDASEAGYAAWFAATVRLRDACDALYSPDLVDLIRGLSGGDPTALDAVITFLEVDPWVFRSGYSKEAILARLARAHLAEADKDRIRAALLASVVKGPRREFPLMLRLAHHVRSQEFGQRLGLIAAAGTPGRSSAARRMLAAVEGSRRSGQRHRRRWRS